jgi:hypothetical protein
MPAQPLQAFFNFRARRFHRHRHRLRRCMRMFLGQPRGQTDSLGAMFAHGLVFAPAALAIGVTMLPVARIEFYPVVLSSFVLFWIAYRFGWRAGAIALVLLSASTYMSDDNLFAVWRPVQLQLLMAAAGFATLTLGISADSLRTQGRALKASIDMLSSRTRAWAKPPIAWSRSRKKSAGASAPNCTTSSART